MSETPNTQKTELISSANYIVDFYQLVEALTGQYSAYMNLIAESKIKTTNIEEMDEEIKEAFKIGVQNIRLYCTTAYVKTRTLLKRAKKTEIKITEIEKAYKKAIKEYVINSEDLEAYVFLLNDLLAEEVLTEIFESSNSLLQGVYNNG